MLFVEFHGTEAGVAEQAGRFGEIAEEFGGGPFDWATKAGGPDAAVGRPPRRLLGRAGACGPASLPVPTDVCVPISRLAECVDETKRDIAATGLIAPIVGHVGDGNFHVQPLVDMQRAAPRLRTVTGLPRAPRAPRPRHGGDLHGRARRRAGEDEVSPGGARRAALDAMLAIKRALDPTGHHEPGQDRHGLRSRRSGLGPFASRAGVPGRSAASQRIDHRA